MKFNELVKGKIYTDREGCGYFKFNGYYNSQLAEFIEMELDDVNGYLFETDNILLFNKFEVTDLSEL